MNGGEQLRRTPALRRTVVGVLLAAVVAAPPVVPAADAGSRPDHVHTVVIGDSIAYWGSTYLHWMRPRWVIDAVRGRRVDALPDRISANVDEHGVPRNLVLALGSNGVRGWTRADYRAATLMVPDTVDVFFVTTYRDPRIAGERRARRQARYSSWMRAIARTRANVYILPWRHLVRTGRATLENDVHPDERSRRVWAEMVRDGVARPTGWGR